MFIPMMPFSKSKRSKKLKQPSIPPIQHRCEELSTRLNAYSFRQRLGRGAFGQVYLAETNTQSSSRSRYAPCGERFVAVKIVRRTMLAKDSTRALARAEAENLRRVSETRSLFFTQLRETFCDPHNLYIVTDYLAGGTLRHEITRRHRHGKPIPNDRIVLIMAQLVEALSQLRALRIVHRDIKPDNVLIDAHGNLVLADFGLSRRFEKAFSSDSEEFSCNEDERRKRERSALMCNSRLSLFKIRRDEKGKGKKRADSGSGSPCDTAEDTDRPSAYEAKSCMTDTGCGTLAYAAPEMHRGEAYSFAADAYSLGVIFYELLFSRLPPYPPTTSEPIYTCSAGWFFDTLGQTMPPVSIEPTALHLLTSLMSLDPSTRITFPEIRAHLFFAGIHWSTLAAHAYTLPARHAPPTYLYKYRRRPRPPINPGIFVDPLVVLLDGPDRALEGAYNVEGCRKLAWRPGEERGCWYKDKAGQVVRGARGTAVNVFNFARGLGRPVRRRNWIRDVEEGREEPFVKVVAFEKSVFAMRNSGSDEGVTIKIEIDAGQEDSVVVDSRHIPSASPRVHFVTYEPRRPHALRRITDHLPARQKSPAPPHLESGCPSASSSQDEPESKSKSDSESDSDVSSTVAIFSCSLTGSESLELEIERERTRPELVRLSTDLPPSRESLEPSPPPSPPASPSGEPSSPVPSSFNLAFYLTRALEHLLPFSSSAASIETPAQAEIHPTKTSARVANTNRGSSILHSSCPSLLPSSSGMTSASSSLPITPLRGNSHLPSMVAVQDQDHSMLSATAGMPNLNVPSGLPYVESVSPGDAVVAVLDKGSLRRRASVM